MQTKNKKEETVKQFTTLQSLYDHFNKTLFNNELENTICNLSRKGKRNYGFFAPDRWKNGDNKKINEISLNPLQFHRSDLELISTLVHEMVHQWQYQIHKVCRAYHDKVWGVKMKEIGLHPSDTGLPRGKETGQQMTHYIIQDGKFIISYETIKNKIQIPYKSFESNENKKTKKKKSESKTKYTCPECETNVWGKPELNIICADCENKMIPE